MRPLCRILSISAVDLHTIVILLCLSVILKRGSYAFLRMMIFQYPENLVRDVVHRQIAVHRDQPARALVVVRDRTSLLLVCRESWLNHFQPVVVAGHQLRPVVLVTKFIHAGRLEVDVINPSTGGTRTASSDPEQ